MLFHDSILWAMNQDGISFIDITCDSSKREKVSKFFKETFEKYWADAENEVEEEYGDCCEKDKGFNTPETIQFLENGFRVILDSPYLSFNEGETIEFDGFAQQAILKTMKKLLKKYPDISYDGFIGFRWSDSHSGGTTQYELSSNQELNMDLNKTYDYIGKKLSSEMDDNFWEELKDQLYDCDVEDFEQVAQCFHLYKNWISEDALKKLLNIAHDYGKDIYLKQS